MIIVFFPDLGAVSGKIVYMVDDQIVAFCDILFKIVVSFSPDVSLSLGYFKRSGCIHRSRSRIT